MTVETALEGLYESLSNDNEDIDLHISNLKNALKDEQRKHVEIDPERLFQNNREGRKMLQSYCKRRGVKIIFKSKT
jgi:hypothetical protein